MNVEAAEQAVEDAARVVEFELGDETCAIDIHGVDSIVESKQVTRVPRAPDAVEGVMDLRGETTAIVDPREFLAIDGETDSENILVLDRADDKQKIGLRVAEVTEVSGYADFQVDEDDNLERIGTDAIHADLVKGVIRKGVTPPGEEDADEGEVELVLWLDLDEVIDAVDDGEKGDNQR
jgi:purine-binding chemotaxis protein CheW